MDKYYKNIKSLIENNIVEVRKQEISVNNHTLMTYFNVGKLLVEAQCGEKRTKYGDGLIKEYSKKLTLEFGKGYNPSNLKNMRQLYWTFRKGRTVCDQLTWSHYRYILPIKNNSYERLIGNKDKIELKYISNNKELTILDMIKDPILISIGNKKIDKLTEKALKKYILESIEKVLLELGVGFSFVGSEKKIKVGNNYRYFDLVFFNYELNCFVLNRGSLSNSVGKQ